MITTGSSSGPSCTCGGLQASKFVPKLNKDQSGDGDVELNLMTMMMAMTMSLHFGRLASTLLYLSLCCWNDDQDKEPMIETNIIQMGD